MCRRMAAQHLVTRGAAPPLMAVNLELVDAIMKLAVLQLPPVPDGAAEPLEEPPEMAIPSTWWRAQMALLLLAVLNMKTIGRAAMERIPPLQLLCEVLMTQSPAQAMARHDDQGDLPLRPFLPSFA